MKKVLNYLVKWHLQSSKLREDLVEEKGVVARRYGNFSGVEKTVFGAGVWGLFGVCMTMIVSFAQSPLTLFIEVPSVIGTFGLWMVWAAYGEKLTAQFIHPKLMKVIPREDQKLLVPPRPSLPEPSDIL